MYKKLMFLISLVALLGFVSVVSAVDWTGDGATASACDVGNWDGAIAGQELQVNPATGGSRGPIFDCGAIAVDSVRGGPDGDMAIDWVSGGHLTVTDWDERWGTEGDGVATFNFLGGSLTCLEERMRIANEESDAFINVSGDFVLTVVDGEFRFGDSDDIDVTWVMDGGTINLPEGDLQFGDDCGGSMTFTGGTLDIGERFRIIGRKKSQTVNIGGTTDMYMDGDFRIGENCGEDEAATVTLNMTGGTVDARRVNTNGDASGDDGIIEVNLSGGLLIAREEFKVNETDGATTVSITGGVLECGDIDLNSDGVVDVNGPIEPNPGAKTEGVIIIDGDKTAKVAGFVSDGALIGNGSARGVGYDYDVTNSGKTTVYAQDYDKCVAWGPTPANGATGVVVAKLLEWNPGQYLGARGRHGLYLSDDYDEVLAASGTAFPFKAWILPPAASYDTTSLGLELWKSYYWRIDEIGEAPCPLGVGEVWTFTTGCELIDGDLNLDCVVDFKDYAMETNVMGDEAFFP